MNVFGEATPLSMHQVVKGVAIWSIVTNIPVLPSLKNDLKTNGFLTDNAAKAKCPVWCADNDEIEWDALNYTTYNASRPSEQN